MTYVLDPELAAAAATPARDYTDVVSAREAERTGCAQRKQFAGRTPMAITDLTVTSSHPLITVPARLYVAADRAADVPALVYLHGGGYVVGGLPTADFTARTLVERAGVAVVTVDYRLAPEHPYPAALEDSYVVLRWVVDHGHHHGIDPRRVAVFGESAGAGLAAACTLLARARGGPHLTAQILDAPVIDDRLNTPSMTALTDAPVLPAASCAVIWGHYLGGAVRPGSVEVPVSAAPARACTEDLVGLPPAYVSTYQVDPTRDEGLDYARRLLEADVPTDIHNYAGAFHCAHSVPGTNIGARMVADRIAAIRRLLQVSPAASAR